MSGNVQVGMVKRPRLTPRREQLARERLRAVCGFFDFIEQTEARRAAWRNTNRRWWGRGLPAAPTRGVWQRKLAQRGIRMSMAALRRWESRFLQLGADGLVDGRGRRPGMRPADPVLFGRLLEAVAAGESVAAADKELRAIATAQGRSWPVLRTLQVRVARHRETLKRNPHLFAGLSEN